MRVVLSLVCLLVCALSATAAERPMTRPGGTMTLSAPNLIYSMDPNGTVYSSITITNGTITGLSTSPNANPTITLPPNAAVYPGFIDSHSHAFSLLMASAKSMEGVPYWTSLANVNVMLKKDFLPVTTQQQVTSILRDVKPNPAGWVLGWNYEPSRLTCGSTYGFLCPNFENQSQQTALQQMDAIRTDVPMLVTSQSGHIAYVNTKALALMNICGLAGSTPDGCHTPTLNPAVETRLAETGQLNEDLALRAIGVVEGILRKNFGRGFMEEQIIAALDLYSQLGYTTVQEGAASEGMILTYMDLAKKMATARYIPVRMAFLAYDDTTPANFGSTAKSARQLQAKLAAGGFDMFIAGLKVYSDGSNQGYTGDMLAPAQYMNLAPPYTNPLIYPQPYDGLPDYDACAIASAADEAHRNNFPLWVHTNGNQAQANVVVALIASRSPKLRDVIVHFTMPSQAQLSAAAANGIGATFLVNDFYYYYQPLCEQILGPSPNATANLYPAAWAQAAGMPYSLHSDASVTPPTPWFGVWVASTRSFQQVGPNPVSPACAAAAKNQAITRQQALAAYTSQAAWLYNRDTTAGNRPGIGSLQQGFAGDLVVLSEDPMTAPDLSKIYVLYTIHNGNVVYPASGKLPGKTVPVWPD
jgi:predicted amidohydrolase YtcJ